MIVFLDMDGVIADFHEAAIKLIRLNSEEAKLERTWLKTSGDGMFRRPISDLVVRALKTCDRDFWREIPILPWAHRLVDAVGSLGFTTAVLSDPMDHNGAYNGKLDWLKDHFGDKLALVATSHKYLVARRGSLLVDDKEENCWNFIKSGGRSVVWPSPYVLRDVELVESRKDVDSAISRLLDVLTGPSDGLEQPAV